MSSPRQFIDPHIVLTSAPGGFRCDLTPGRNKLPATMFVFVGLVFITPPILIAIFSYHRNMHGMNWISVIVPAVAAIPCSIIGGALIWLALFMVLENLTITVNQGVLTTKSVAPMRIRQQQLSAEKIEDVIVKIDGRGLGGVTYCIVAVPKIGKRIFLGGMISNKDDAEWLADEIRKSFLKRDHASASTLEEESNDSLRTGLIPNPLN